MIKKFKFYERYGVEEYYIYDPDDNELTGWQRIGDELVDDRRDERLDQSASWGSDSTCSEGELRHLRPRRQAVSDFTSWSWQRNAIAEERDQIAQERDQVAQERDQVAQELQAERERAERLAAQLRSLGVEPRP